MSSNVIPYEVAKFGAKLKAARSQGEAWPLLICDEVLALANRWHTIRSQIPGKPQFNTFLREQGTGRSWNLGRFKLVQRVIERLGESCRRTWLWPSALWVYNTVPDGELTVVLDLYPQWMDANYGHPLSRGMVVARVKAMREQMGKGVVSA